MHVLNWDIEFYTVIGSCKGLTTIVAYILFYDGIMSNWVLPTGPDSRVCGEYNGCVLHNPLVWSL